MMAAGVADPRERVVFAEQADIGAALPMAVNRTERRRYFGDSPLDFKSFFLKPYGQILGRMKLFHPDFRMVKNVIGHGRHFFPHPVNFLIQGFLRHKKHLRRLISQLYQTTEVFVQYVKFKIIF